MLKEEFLSDFAEKYSAVHIDDIESGVIVCEIVDGTYLVGNEEVKE